MRDIDIVNCTNPQFDINGNGYAKPAHGANRQKTLYDLMTKLTSITESF
jgi:hypothetical protein